MKEQVTINQRLKEFINTQKISVRKFERTIGVANGFVSNISDGVGADKLRRICSKYPTLNTDWLLTGEGEMLLTEAKTTGKAKMIRYYPEVEGSAGGVQFMEDPNERCIEISIPFCTDCSCAINVHGDSMSPRIRSGQVVLLSEWTENFIDWGKIYLVVTQSGYRCIKYLFPSADGESITCRSENSDSNPDFNISKDDIARLFIVKGWICRDAI